MKSANLTKRIFWTTAALSAVYLMAGCAATTPHEPVKTVAHEISVDHKARPAHGKFVRRSAAVFQGGTLYARSVYVDPVNRPVSNALSAASFAFKSLRGFTHRTAISAVQFPELERQPIPDVI